MDASQSKKFIFDKVMTVVEKVGEDVESQMKADAPVDTGFLKANIGHHIEETSDEIELEFYSNAPYSGFVDKGTSKMNAQPFFECNLIGLDRKIKEKLNGGSL